MALYDRHALRVSALAPPFDVLIPLRALMLRAVRARWGRGRRGDRGRLDGAVLEEASVPHSTSRSHAFPLH